MRIAVNLASEPFRRNRPMILASIGVGVLMAASFSLLMWLILAERDRLREAREAVARTEATLRSVNNEIAQIEAQMRRPDRAEVLDLSVFLNTLIARKAISWTKIFSDLEGVLPHNVRLISVRPQADRNNQIRLEMVVGAQSGEPVIELLKRLEESPLFGSTAVQSWLPPSQTEPLFRYRVSTNYAQQL